MCCIVSGHLDNGRDGSLVGFFDLVDRTAEPGKEKLAGDGGKPPGKPARLDLAVLEELGSLLFRGIFRWAGKETYCLGADRIDLSGWTSHPQRGRLTYGIAVSAAGMSAMFVAGGRFSPVQF